MSEVIPMSDIILLFDVPLSPEYENTFYFINKQEQQNWFKTYYQKISFTNQSYQRKERGWLRISAMYADVYCANYMMFKNNSPIIDGDYPIDDYEQHWYYAFIKQVKYINERTAEIEYEIDVLQSYMFEWTFQDTFIERETTESDEIGEHIIDEGLPIGDYVNNKVQEMRFTTPASQSAQSLKDTYFIVACTFDVVNGEFVDATDGYPTNQVVGGMPVGCKYRLYNSAQAVVDFLNTVPGEKLSGILSINCVPFIATINYVVGPSGGLHHNIYSDLKSNWQSTEKTLDGYKPKNKKLYCYPYNLCLIQGADGSAQEFAYEQFPGTSLIFNLDIICSLPVQGMIYPAFYKTQDGATEFLRTPYAIYLPPTATCTFSSDTFKAWYALNSGFMALSTASALFDGAVSVARPLDILNNTPNVTPAQETTAAYGGLSGVKSSIERVAANQLTIRNAKRAPDSYNGTAQNQLLLAAGLYNVWHVNRCLRKDYAESIDNYFTMYGYRVNKIKRPYLTNRTRFTYIKTADMDIGGFIPSDDKVKICEIFNRGIRWWLDIGTIGDYTSPNVPRG